jgi:quinolinate synthase
MLIKTKNKTKEKEKRKQASESRWEELMSIKEQINKLKDYKIIVIITYNYNYFIISINIIQIKLFLWKAVGFINFS